jgi:Spy/CpxP family protein refolding chaperone
MQKSGKLSLLLVLALALSLGLAGSVWAQPMGKGMGKGMGPGPGMMNLTPDQAGMIFDLMEKMHTDTASLRRQMMVKRAEMAALWKMEKPDKTSIQAKQKELNALRDQMQEKMMACRLEAKKIAPNFDMGMGMGHGCCMGLGHGPGMGMGPGGKGMGPGAGPPPPPPASAPSAPPAPPAK